VDAVHFTNSIWLNMTDWGVEGVGQAVLRTAKVEVELLAVAVENRLVGILGFHLLLRS
jgi:hypothetical protein